MDLRLQCAVRPHSLDPVLLPVGLIIFAQPPYASRLRPDNEPAHARLCTHGMRAAGRCRPAAQTPLGGRSIRALSGAICP